MIETVSGGSYPAVLRDHVLLRVLSASVSVSSAHPMACSPQWYITVNLLLYFNVVHEGNGIELQGKYRISESIRVERDRELGGAGCAGMPWLRKHRKIFIQCCTMPFNRVIIP
jgi:hypothetical protein